MPVFNILIAILLILAILSFIPAFPIYAHTSYYGGGGIFTLLIILLLCRYFGVF